MQISRWRKTVFWLSASVFVGALGSGLWELALKPGGHWLGQLILTGATLGSRLIKDQIYMEAAKGNHEAIARHSTSILYWGFGLACGALTGGLLGASRLRSPKGPGQENQAERASPSRWRLPARGYAFIVLSGLLFSTASFLVGSLKVEVANDAYTFFSQSLAICRPYISDHEARLLESRFAAIRGRDDYIGVINDLGRIAASNQLKLPDFKPW